MKVLTEVDYLRGKAKKNYINGGIVTMFNMYDDIKNVPSYDEIFKMDYETGRNLILAIKEKHSVKDLVKHFGVSDFKMYHHLYPKFDIATRNYNDTRRKKSSKESKTNKSKIKTANTLALEQHMLAVENDIKVSSILEQQRNDIVQAAVVVKSGVETILSKLNDNEQDGLFQRIKGVFSGKEASDRILSATGQLTEFKKYKILLQISEIYEQGDD